MGKFGNSDQPVAADNERPTGPTPPDSLGREAKKLFSASQVLTTKDFTPTEVLKDFTEVGWREDPDWQSETFCKMHMIWDQFTKKQAEEAFSQSLAHVNRLKITGPDDEAKWLIFEQLMRLPTSEDVSRALSWDPRLWADYVPLPDEQEYLELPGFVGRFVDTYKESFVPAPFFAWAALGLLGITCKYNAYVQVGGEELIHNMYLFFVGSSAAGKSYAKNCAMDVVKRLNRKLNTRLASPAAEGLAPVVTEYERPDLWVNILPRDATYEAIIQILSDIREVPLARINDRQNGLTLLGRYADASGCLVVDEVAEHFGRGDWAADKKLAGYTGMYMSTSHSKATLSRGEKSYDHQAFSMMVCGAVEWFRGAVTPAMMKGGFMDRCQFIYRPGTPRIYTALEMPVVDPIRVEALAEDLLLLASPPNEIRRQIRVSPEARDRLNEISRAEFKKEIQVRQNEVAEIEGRASAVRREHLKIKLSSLLAISGSDLQPAGGRLRIPQISVRNIELADRLVCNEDLYFAKFLDLVHITGTATFASWLRMEFIRNSWKPISERALLQRTLRREEFKIQNTQDLLEKLKLLAEGEVIFPCKMKAKGKKGSTANVHKERKGWGGSQDWELWDRYV